MHSLEDIGNAVPAFLVKLWKIVEDPETNDLIAWNPTGTGFCIRNQAQFSHELLPLYYKHNNMASFIRQLNMYGFHKVASPEGGCLKPDKDEIEFAHPGFVMGHPYLLSHIKRKIPVAKYSEGIMGEGQPELMKRVLTDVKGLKGRQESVTSQLTEMKRENEVLWREVAVLRQKHLKQQQIVNKLIQFLVSMVHTSRSGGLGIKRHYPYMLSHVPHTAAKSAKLNDSLGRESLPSGPVIHELDPTDLLDECAPQEEESTANEEYLVADLIAEPEEVASTPGTSECDLETAVNASSPEMLLELAEECSLSPFSDKLKAKSTRKKHKKTSARKKRSKKSEPEVDEESPSFSAVSNRVLNEVVEHDEVIPATMNDNAQDGLDMKTTSAASAANSGTATAGTSATNMALARTDSSDISRCAPTEDLDLHLDSMDSELDSLKELLKGEGYSLDANTILSLFNEDPYSYELPFPMEKEVEYNGPGSELAPFSSTLDLSDMLGGSSDEWPQLPAIPENATSTEQVD